MSEQGQEEFIEPVITSRKRYEVIQWIRDECIPEMNTLEWVDFFLKLCDIREHKFY